MAYNKLLLPTPQISTGNWATVDDPNSTTPPQGIAAQVPAFFGIVFPVYDTVNTTTIVIQYVEFNPTTNTTAVKQGAAVYWKDTTRTVVSQVIAEAVTNASSSDSAIDSFAGVYGGSTAPGSVTDGIWILKRGFFANFIAGTTFAVGDRAVLSNGAATAPVINAYTHIAAGTAIATAEAATVYISATGTGGTASGFFPGFLLAGWP